MSRLKLTSLFQARNEHYEVMDEAIKAAVYAFNGELRTTASKLFGDGGPGPLALIMMAKAYDKIGAPTTVTFDAQGDASIVVKVPTVAENIVVHASVDEEEDEPTTPLCTYRTTPTSAPCGQPGKRRGRGAYCKAHRCARCKHNLAAPGGLVCQPCKKRANDDDKGDDDHE